MIVRRNSFALVARVWGALLVILLTAGAARASSDPVASSWVPTRPSNDVNTRKGFDNFYNLDYDKAIRDFEAALPAHPDDPFAVNHLLSGVIFKELLRIGALDTEAYASDNFLDKKNLQPDRKSTRLNSSHLGI